MSDPCPYDRYVENENTTICELISGTVGWDAAVSKKICKDCKESTPPQCLETPRIKSCLKDLIIKRLTDCWDWDIKFSDRLKKSYEEVLKLSKTELGAETSANLLIQAVKIGMSFGAAVGLAQTVLPEYVNELDREAEGS